MDTKTKFIRIIFALVFALSALGISATAALAKPPVRYEGSVTNVSGEITDVCSFSYIQTFSASWDETDFFDNSGVLTRIKYHIDELDTLSANGKTLVGMPYTGNYEFLYDSNGNLTAIYGSGGYFKFKLPDGSMFNSKGRVNVLTHNGPLITPDKGVSGNIAGLCAALAP